MSAATKRAVPTLAQRVESLKTEVDAELDRLAEERRPKGEAGAVPAGVIRQLWLAKAAGNIFDAFLLASKECNR